MAAQRPARTGPASIATWRGAPVRARRVRRVVAPLAAATLLLLALSPSVTTAAIVTATWQARLGTSGTNGSATIRAYWGGTGSLALALARLPAGATLAVTLSKGTCAATGSVLIVFPAIRTTSAGSASRTSGLTAGQVSIVRSATSGTGRIALRVGRSCGAFPANPFPSPTLATVGPLEVVFNWSVDRCEDLDIPDLPARAFRDAQGNVQLIAAHYINRRFVGSSLNAVKHDCAVIMASAGDPNPAAFSYHQWIASPYTTDGQTIYALVHDEYYGSYPDGGSCQWTCWYNAITLAVSTDGGASYHPAATPPANLVASSPRQYEAGAGPYGFFNPSNIIRGPDGYYYAYLHEFWYRHPSTDQGVCLIRTPDLADASAWRAWDGTGFSVAFVNPYLHPAEALAAPTCRLIPQEPLGLINDSITFNTYLRRYVMVGTTWVVVDGLNTWSIAYSFSDDLVHWSARRQLVDIGDSRHVLYASLIDPNSPSRDFETTGQFAYLYTTRFNQSGNYLDRDLIRIPVEFFPTAAAASAARVPFTP